MPPAMSSTMAPGSFSSGTFAGSSGGIGTSIAGCPLGLIFTVLLSVIVRDTGSNGGL